MAEFSLTVNKKGGAQYRKYSQDTLQMLFDTSPSAACFEITIVVEGLIFTAVRLIYILTNNEKGYEKFLRDKKDGESFYNAIEKLYFWGVIDKNLKDDLHTFRTMRNEIAHDLFQLKTVFTTQAPKFRDYSHDEVLKNFFDKGLEVFSEMGDIITPGVPTKEEFIKKFSGFYKRT